MLVSSLLLLACESTLNGGRGFSSPTSIFEGSSYSFSCCEFPWETTAFELSAAFSAMDSEAELVGVGVTSPSSPSERKYIFR